MLDDLLPGPIEAELKRTIVERSEGNPLYVEEIVRKLIDDGVLRATEASRWEVARPVARDRPAALGAGTHRGAPRRSSGRREGGPPGRGGSGPRLLGGRPWWS